MNETFFLGTGTPSATMVPDDSPYFPGPEWRNKWANHDPAQANQLLDGIGLTARDAEGFRMRPDGAGRIRLSYAANRGFADYPAMGEELKKQWRAIGIDLTVEVLEVNLTIERIFANDMMIQGTGGVTSDLFVKRDGILPANSVSGTMGIPYARWLDSGGRTGLKPPEPVGQIVDMFQLHQRGTAATDDERAQIGKQIYQTHADQVWSIGVLGFGLAVYGLYYAKNSLGNVPARVVNDEAIRSPVNTFPMTFFYR
jgi:peptide/nickel transport system substrate-binding protein